MQANDSKCKVQKEALNKRSSYICQGWQDHLMRKEQSFQQKALGKLDIHKQNNEVGPLLYTIHRNQLKM